MSSEPTQTYVDISLVNNKIDNDQVPIPVIFSSRRDQDYLKSPRDYLVSVVRWSLDVRLPLIVPQLKLNTPVISNYPAIDQWETVYYVTFVDPTGMTATNINILFQPQINQYVKPPITSITNLSQLYDNPYFHITSADYWLQMLNVSLSNGYSLFLTQTGLAGNPLYPNDPPIFQYDGQGNVSLTVPQNFLYFLPNGQGNPAPIFMYFNGALNTLFNGLSTLINPVQNPINYQHYRLYFTGTLPLVSPPLLVPYYRLSNEYPSVPFWSPLSSIVFTTNQIPVEPANANPTVIIGSSASTNNNNINLASVITDFDINFVTGLESRQINYYTPLGEYRLIDLVSNRPLSDINISVFWRDKIQGNLHNLYLHSGAGASIKLLFRRRNFFSENL
jgi:hypothetical protein